MSKNNGSASQPHNYPKTPAKSTGTTSVSTPFVNKAASHSTRTYPSGLAWRVNNGFRSVLKRELEDAILHGPSLHIDIFSDLVIFNALGKSLHDLMSDTSVLRDEGRWKGLPNDQKPREQQWTSFLSTITSTIAKSTGRQPKRSWSAQYATAAVKNEHSIRKPDLVLYSKSPDSWADFESFAEEKCNPDAHFAKGDDSLDIQLADRAYFMFSRQANRRFIVGLSFAGSFLRLSMFDRAGVVHGPFIDITDPAKHLDFLRIVLGLAFCESSIIGYDPTIISVNGVTHVLAGQKKYRILEDLFISDVICGRGTVVRKAVLDDDSKKVFVIKDVWVDASRPYTEDHFLDQAKNHGVENVPRLVSREDVQSHHGFGSTRFHFRRPPHATIPPSGQDKLEERIHRRYVMEGCGIPITQFRSKKELLQTMADLLKTHKDLINAGILHRDISIRNLMFWYGHVPEAQVESTRRGLVIDFDYATMISEHRTQTISVAHRTGTIPFMARDILRDTEDHAPKHDIESFFYVLVFLCLEYDGPGRERTWNHKDNKKWDLYKTGLGKWVEGQDLSQIGSSKAADVADKTIFRRLVLDMLPPYFQDLSNCLEKIRMEIVIRPQLDDKEVTHDSIISILEEWAATPLNEGVPPSQPNVGKSATPEPDTVENGSLKR